MSIRNWRSLGLALAAMALAVWLPSSNVEAQTEAKPVKKATATKSQATHKVAIQVSQNDKAVMDLALNNAKNIIDYYKGKGETVAIEIVTYGPGLHMLRSDTSPVKDRIAPMALENPTSSSSPAATPRPTRARPRASPSR